MAHMDLLGKVLKKIYKSSLIFLAISFFFSCQSSQDIRISKEDRKWMEHFFFDLMLEEQAIYTLLGSKPLTRIVLYNYSKEKIEEYLQGLTEEEKKNARIITEYDFPENWEKWKKIADRFPMKRYILCEAKWERDSEAEFIYFVDILKTALIMQEHYMEFREVIGSDFSPIEVVLEMKEFNAPTWEKIARSPLLWGILFGFGKGNSYAFYWKNLELQGQTQSEFFNQLTNAMSCEKLTGNKKRTLKNLEIPSFISFIPNDPTIKKYKEERKTIQEFYAHHDFLTTTLDQMTKN